MGAIAGFASEEAIAPHHRQGAARFRHGRACPDHPRLHRWL